MSDRDRTYIERAVREAKRRNPNRPAAVYDFVRDVLLSSADYIPDSERDEHLRFIGKFQQVTSPVTAKGIEDTALYIYNRLVSLNEVGGEPDQFCTAACVAARMAASDVRTDGLMVSRPRLRTIRSAARTCAPG